MDAVAEIKARLNIVDVLAGRVELKRAGKNYKACCPFHQEKTPSFMVSPERGFAWCYGCQTGGDIFKIVELLEGLDFKETLKLLAEKAGVELPQYSGGVKKEKKDRLIEINEAAAEFFAKELNKNDSAKEYLKKRGLTKETLEYWQIGYAPSGYDGLHKKLEAQKYTKKELTEAGVAGLKEMAGEALYDRFRDRIMFPIADARGRAVAFTGRVLGDGEPKYLNSPESVIFTKGAILFGLDKAKDAIRKEKFAVVVEGQMDVIACHQAGFTNVVASSGTALTETHLATLAKITDTVIFAFDADQAGIDSTKRALTLAIRQDLNVKVVKLDGFKDPDEMIQRDPELFKAALESALSLFDFYFAVVYREQDLSNVTTKKQIARELLTLARSFQSAIEREDFVKKLALKLQISEGSLTDELKNLPAAVVSQRAVEEETVAINPAHFTREDTLIALVLAFPAALGESVSELRQLTLAEPVNAKILTELLNTDLKTDTALAALSVATDRDRAEQLILYAEDKYAEFSEKVLQKEFQFLLSEIGKFTSELKKRELLARLHTAEEAGETEQAGELLREYQALLKS